MTRYPNYITFAWQRSDGDYEVVGTLNGETIEDGDFWNFLVTMMLTTLRLSEPDTQAYHREDVYAVIDMEGVEDWEPIKVGAN